ncbi:MAG: bifunctional 5,10-methylene-tetrahydrofolate dehydrogenase/5,10-methylene-tetrahydrofolate cyclohydrolase [Verrucomicrobiales bacterium]|nr:bifunctional 5,10-methylene-tetrahydrofolate dehydrogenase/5,10-methylene-tetrahydrofolate cyclohydrolase [Verrucomicrobiales bacterium]
MEKANLIDGRAISQQIHSETKERVEALKQRGVQPGLVFVRVGEDPASKVYVGMKEKRSAEAGIHSTTKVLAETTTQEELLKLIHELNANPDVHGILVQAPLPGPISEQVIFSTVSPSKDVDGFHPENVGKLMLGDTTGFRPCTPAGVHELLIRSKVKTSGSQVVVLGRGNIVGKPMTAILCQKSDHANATVSLCHSRTKNIAEHCRAADIIIAAMGVPLFVKEDMVSEGATIIDVGVNRISDENAPKGYRLVGDVDFEKIQPKAGLITPNPGGVGPMTIAMLLQNTVLAAEKQTS